MATKEKAGKVGVFDFGSHIKSMLYAPTRPPGFAALDGYRAFLCLWVIVFHSLAYLVGFYNDEQLKSVCRRPELNLLMIGLIAVDAFFVLTGFLLAYPMFEAEKKEKSEKAPGGSSSLQDWYWRRLSRMIPPYWLVLVLFCGVFFSSGQIPMTMMVSEFQNRVHHKHFPNETYWPSNCDKSWGNVLFINNLIPGGGCMGHSWSLAVQFQWYLWVPLLFRWLGTRRKLVTFLIGGVVVSTAFRVFAFFQLITFAFDSMDFVFVSFFWYSSTFARMNAFCLGSLAAYLHAKTNFGQWLKQARWFRLLSLLITVAVVTANSQWSGLFWRGNLLEAPGNCALQAYSSNGGAHHPLFYIFLAVGSPLSAYMFAYGIFIMIERVGTIGSLLSRFLGHKAWFPVAQLSYLAYLLHPLWMVKKLVVYGAYDITNINLVFYHAVWLVVVTLTASAVLYVIFEKPVDVWLRNSEHPRLSSCTHKFVMLLLGLSALAHLLFYVGILNLKLPDDARHGAPDPRIAEKVAWADWLTQNKPSITYNWP